ncbi:MAG: hypothetical protein ABIO80_08805 [Sphingomicrobium sp.]
MRYLAAALLLLLAACDRDVPPAPNADQSNQLNNAEDMLNAMAANEEGPEQSPGPSTSTH